MGKRKREPMSEGKKNIIGMLLEEYDIRSATDIEDALKDLLGGTIQEMLESEMDEHLGYSAYERSDMAAGFSLFAVQCGEYMRCCQ